jgi:hypothetical protein
LWKSPPLEPDASIYFIMFVSPSPPPPICTHFTLNFYFIPTTPTRRLAEAGYYIIQ